MSKTGVTSSELLTIQNNLLLNMKILQSNKFFIPPEYYQQLSNYHQYCVNIINKMQFNVVEQSQPHPQFKAESLAVNTGNPWESQFNETVKNPQMYSLPPTNTWASSPWNSNTTSASTNPYL